MKLPKKNTLAAVLTAAVVGFGVNALVGPSATHTQPASAAGSSDTATTPNCTVGQGSGVTPDNSVTPPTSTNTTNTTNTTTTTTDTDKETTHDNHDVVTVHNLVHDVKVGDVNVLSNDLNSNSVLNNADVDVSNVLNPVTSVLSNIHL